MKHLVRVVSLIFLPKTLTWNKITFQLINSLNLTELVVNELTKSISKTNCRYSFFYPIYPLLIVKISKACNYKERENHCVKSVQKQRFFWTVFSRIRTEYGDPLYLCVFSPNVGKDRSKKTPYLDTFHAVNFFKNSPQHSLLFIMNYQFSKLWE